MGSRIKIILRSGVLTGVAWMGLLAAAQAQNSTPATGAAKLDLNWALGYAGQYSDALTADQKFVQFVGREFDSYSLPFWKPNRPSAAVVDFLGGPSDPILLMDNRYLSASGCVAHYCPNKGFFWLDTKTGETILGFIDIDHSGAANEPHLWQLLGRTLRFGSVPDAAWKAIQQWYGTFRSERGVLQGGTLTPEKIKKVTEIEVASGKRRTAQLHADQAQAISTADDGAIRCNSSEVVRLAERLAGDDEFYGWSVG